MSKRKFNQGNTTALITYIIAVIILIAGLALPITVNTFKGGGINFKSAPVLQLGGALAALGIPIKTGGLTEDYSYILTAFKKPFDLGAVFLLFYALATAIAIILLIAAFVAKGDKKLKIIFFSELFALTALLPLGVLELLRNSWNLNILAALGVTLLMLIIQSLVYRKGSGVIKLILFLLSAAAVLFTATSISGIIPALASPLRTFADAIKGKRPFETGIGLYSIDGKDIFGSSLLNRIFAKDFNFASGGKLGVTVAGWIAISALSLAAINLYLDMLGLGKKTNRFMLVSNVIRYSLEFALIIALAVTIIFASGNFGIMLYLLALIALVQLLIQIIRDVKFKKAYAKEKSKAMAEETVDEDAEIPDSDEEYAFDSLPEETAASSSEPVIETRNVVYNLNTIYNGPTDDFINKLTPEQKVEFARLFLEKRTTINGIPDYVVGGDNSRFFSNLFIYFSRVRDLVTDGLMNKFYEEVKVM